MSLPEAPHKLLPDIGAKLEGVYSLFLEELENEAVPIYKASYYDRSKNPLAQALFGESCPEVREILGKSYTITTFINCPIVCGTNHGLKYGSNLNY